MRSKTPSSCGHRPSHPATSVWVPVEPSGNVRVESPATADTQPDDGLLITRDWVVAGTDSAAR